MIELVRLKDGARASAVHLAVSLVVALVAAVVVLGVWYPYPYRELSGGRDLFVLLVCVDVVCGPLLTLVVFNKLKPHAELVRDLGVVVLLQVAALAYGLYSVALARPVYLAFEGDRFRVVCAVDVEAAELGKAPAALRTLSWTGPQAIGVHLLQNDDPEYLRSIHLALAGVHPAFRPSRWMPYEAQLSDVQRSLKSVDSLRQRYPDRAPDLAKMAQEAQVTTTQLGYLPLLGAHKSDWVVLLRRSDAKPVGYLPVDGW